MKTNEAEQSQSVSGTNQFSLAQSSDAQEAFLLSVYPDEEPLDLASPACPPWALADYVHRFCAEVDFSGVPDWPYIETLLSERFRSVVAEMELPHSVFFRVLRDLHELPAQEIPQDCLFEAHFEEHYSNLV